MRDDPDHWDGFPGCDLPGPGPGGAINPVEGPGWQLCPALGFGQLMKMLPNSTEGLQWSTKWSQPYFVVPPGVYPDARTNASGGAAVIWVDNATSLKLKYDWAILNWGGFGIWTADTAGVESGVDGGGDAGRAMWDAIPSPYT